MKTAQRRFARRQLTWMKKMPGAVLIDRSGRDDADVAEQIAAALSQ
jgi:tRNA dimethylallyltransferase